MSSETWPSPDDACREKCQDTVHDITKASDALLDGGLPGHAERLTRAARYLLSLRDSYLSACAENDRLRADAPEIADLRAALWEIAGLDSQAATTNQADILLMRASRIARAALGEP